MKKPSFTAFLLIAAVAGLGGIGLLLRPAPAPAEPSSTAPFAAPATPAGAPAARGAGPDAAMLGRIGALEKRIESLQNAATPREPAGAAAPTPPTPEEMKEQRHLAQQEFDTRVQQHFHEPVQAAFQRTAAAAIQPRAAAVAAQHEGHLLDVDCRTASCVLTVEFPSYTEALQHYPALVTTDYGVGCASAAMLDDPESGDGPYRVQVLMDACEARAGG